ncbi:MAG: energy transducer TonB [Opitutales bacterium]
MLSLNYIIAILCLVLAFSILGAEAPEKMRVDGDLNELKIPARHRSILKKSDFAIVEYTISATGVVLNPKVVSITRPSLARAVVASVSKWTFKGVEKEGRIRRRIPLK